MFSVIIEADSNDGDYITTTSHYSKEEFDDYVAHALIELLTHYGKSNELPRYDNEFDLDIPYNGWDGRCHTLESVIITYVDEHGETWNVKLEGF